MTRLAIVDMPQQPRSRVTYAAAQRSSRPDPFANPARRWRALCEREPAADGHFVYAVKTTGVFCKPSCASRRPLRANVEFFDGVEQANRAGYRACKRCEPARKDRVDPARRAVVAACRLLEGERALRTDAVAARVGLSPAHFVRAFKKHTGVTPQAYRRRVFAQRAKRELARTPSVTRAMYAAGYATPSRFYDSVAPELGMKPSAVSRGAQDQRVDYTVRSCSLGKLLVAWTEQGACHVGFADSERRAVAELHEHFPRFELHRRSAAAKQPDWIDSIVAAVERPTALDIPLDIQGTAFQQRVWQELRRIPPGETRSYREVASALGSPSLSRAVANACARNTLAVVVPCHRVVRSNGDASGYRWHPDRKRELLRREAERS